MVFSYDSVRIIGASVAGTLFCELMSWFIIYRKNTYKQLTASIKRYLIAWLKFTTDSSSSLRKPDDF